MNPGVALIIALVCAHVAMVPIFMIISCINGHPIVVGPEDHMTLPAIGTFDPPPGAIVHPLFQFANVETNRQLTLGIERTLEGQVRLTVPAWCELWESPTGEPESWQYVASYYDSGEFLLNAEGNCWFFGVRPLARP